jgi:hypothetical protein
MWFGFGLVSTLHKKYVSYVTKAILARWFGLHLPRHTAAKSEPGGM